MHITLLQTTILTFSKIYFTTLDKFERSATYLKDKREKLHINLSYEIISTAAQYMSFILASRILVSLQINYVGLKQDLMVPLRISVARKGHNVTPLPSAYKLVAEEGNI